MRVPGEEVEPDARPFAAIDFGAGLSAPAVGAALPAAARVAASHVGALGAPGGGAGLAGSLHPAPPPLGHVVRRLRGVLEGLRRLRRGGVPAGAGFASFFRYSTTES